MTRDTWPHIRVWVTETPAGLDLSFFPVQAPYLANPFDPSPPPTAAMHLAPLSNELMHLARLGAATRAAVNEVTGNGSYSQARPILHQGGPLQYTVHPGRWPKLPYIAHRDPEGRITELVLGAPKHAESPRSGIDGAGVVPYPHDLDVIRALDLLVEDAMCQLTGDDYPAAIRALNAAARAAAPSELPRNGPARPDWWTGGRRNWSAEKREQIPGWSEAGPRTVSGGLPGHGRRR